MMEVEGGGGGAMDSNQIQQEAGVGPQCSDNGDECGGQVESAAAILLEELRQELRRQSEECHYPYDNPGIKERYQDTAHLLYKKTYLKNANFLSFGTRRSSSVSQYGNTPLVLRKSKSTLEQWPSYNSRFGSNSTLADNDDGSDSVVTTPKVKRDGVKKSRGQQRCLQETNLDDILDEDYDGADSGIQVHSRCENRKSFSQYDIHIPRNKDDSLAFLANSGRKTGSIDTMDADTDEDVLEGKDEKDGITGEDIKSKTNEEFKDLRERNKEKLDIENNEFKTEVKNNEILQAHIESQSSHDIEINNEKKEADKLIEEMAEYTEKEKEIEKTEEHIVDEIVEEKFRDSIRKRRDGVKVTTVEGMADKTTRYKLQVGMIIDKEKDVDETKLKINVNEDSEVGSLNKEMLIDDKPVKETLDSHNGAENIDSVKDTTILVDNSLEISNIQMENNLSTNNGANSEDVKLDNRKEISLVDKQMDNIQSAYAGAHSKEEKLDNTQEIDMVTKEMENKPSTCMDSFSKDAERVDIQEINNVNVKDNSELFSVKENSLNRNISDCQGNTKQRNSNKIIEAIDPIIVMRKEKCNINSNEEQKENLFEIFDASKIVDSSVGNIIEGRLVVEVKSAPKTIKDESHLILNKEKYTTKLSKDESQQINNKENVAPEISYKDVSPVNELFITEECDINNVDHVKSEFDQNKTDRKSVLGLEASGRNCVFNSKNETFRNEVQIKLNNIPSENIRNDHFSSVDNNKENEKRLSFQNSSELTPVGSSSPNHPVRTSTDLNISLSESVSSHTSTSPKPPARKHKGHSSLPTSPVLTPKLNTRSVTQYQSNTQNNLVDINTTNVLRESINTMQITSLSTSVKGSSDHLSIKVAPAVTSNDLNTSFEPEHDNMLVNLPLRSPTPPKRSPRNSPRLARHKEASDKRRPTSLILPRDVNTPTVLEPSPNHNHSGLKASVSLSPTSIKERSSNKFSFPYFSLRKEKSKSSDQMLVSKHEKEKSKSSVSLSGSNKNITDSESSKVAKQEGKLETVALIHNTNSHNDGRRVGTRSMLIEGTLKRNFIVIHPLDNSESVGLAPISPHSRNSEAHTIPKALESVKSKVSGAIGSKFDSLRKKAKKKTEEQSQLETEHLDESKNEYLTVLSVLPSPNQSLENTDTKTVKNIETNTTITPEVSSLVPGNKICSIGKDNPRNNVTPNAEDIHENVKSKSGKAETTVHIVTDTTPIYKTTLDPGQNLPPIIPEVTSLVGDSQIKQQQNLVAVRSAPCGGDTSVIEEDSSIVDDQAVIENHIESSNTTSRLCIVM